MLWLWGSIVAQSGGRGGGVFPSYWHTVRVFSVHSLLQFTNHCTMETSIKTKTHNASNKSVERITDVSCGENLPGMEICHLIDRVETADVNAGNKNLVTIKSESQHGSAR